MYFLHHDQIDRAAFTILRSVVRRMRHTPTTGGFEGEGVECSLVVLAIERAGFFLAGYLIDLSNRGEQTEDTDWKRRGASMWEKCVHLGCCRVIASTLKPRWGAVVCRKIEAGTNASTCRWWWHNFRLQAIRIRGLATHVLLFPLAKTVRCMLRGYAIFQIPHVLPPPWLAVGWSRACPRRNAPPPRHMTRVVVATEAAR